MRIIQISDLHFGMNNQALIQPFFDDIAQFKPEIVIISGDVTQRATEAQFIQFKEFLTQLPGQILVVPGNHDIPLYNLLARLIHPFRRYKQHVSPSLEVEFANEQVNILGVNSVTPYKIKDGTLNDKTLARIKNHFWATSGQLNILFFHHNLNYFSGMHHPVNAAEEFISYLKESPIHLVCTGHLHYANIKVIAKNDAGECAILHADSLLSPRTRDKKNGYYAIETNQLVCNIDWRVFKETSFQSQESFVFNFEKNANK